MASDRTTRSADLAVDRLPEPGASLEVLLLEGASFGTAGGSGPRRPHRHDYHELIWARRGRGLHLVDGEPSPVRPGTIAVIGRGRVHVLERARGLHGAVVRFGDELLHGDDAAGASPGWLLAGRGPRTVTVPAAEAPRMEAVIEALHAEARRGPDACGADVQRHLLATLLLWVQRWHDVAGPAADGGAEERLHRRFSEVLERDYRRHPRTRHYAEALGVPAQVLSRALVAVTGRGTKELVIERRMLEAARLLRFTALTVGEVAFRAGFDDQLYFSRAFRRRYGEPPSAYRARTRGRGAASPGG